MPDDNGDGEKVVDPAALARSILDTPKATSSTIPAIETNLLWFIAQAASEITQWGRNTKLRDRQLREFYPNESYFSSALGTVSARNAAFSWTLEGAAVLSKHVQEVLINANQGAGWHDLIVKTSIDLYCLYGQSSVRLGGKRLGKKTTIKKLVDARDSGPVLTVDERGEISERPIVQWEKTPLGDRDWIWLSLKHVFQHSRGRRGGLWITEDHPVLTMDGWLEAGKVRASMLVASGQPEPNEKQAELLTGTLLGDACLQGRSAIRFQFCHSALQEEWAELKMRSLRGFSYSRHIGKGQISLHSESSHGLSSWREQWYPKGKKAVARGLVERYFGTRMLAAWYLDDGNKHSGGGGITLSCEGFSHDDRQWLADLLSRKGYSAKVGSNRIYIGKRGGGAQRLWEDIAPYVPSCLRYKLPTDAVPFREELWELGAARPFMDVVEKAERRPLETGANGIVRTTYHIGVEGTRNFMASGLVVHNTQDNGAFWEIVRQQNRPEGVVIGINHLDTQECFHTGDPLKPVVYRDRKGKLHLLDWWNVVSFAEIPAPIERLPGIQFCALTRLLRAAEILKNITLYEQEKTGGRFNRAVHLVKGISTSEINDALKQATEMANNMGLLRYIQPLVVGSVDPKGDVGHDTIELASMPDNFSKESAVKLYITIIAMAFLSDYQDFAPLPGGNLGTSTQSEILHMKSRGKGPALFMGLIRNALNFRVLPKVVKFGFEEQDLEADEVQADIRKTRAEARKIDLESGVLTLAGARQQALDKGDVSKEIFEMMGDEEEGEEQPTTPVDVTRGDDQPGADGGAQVAQGERGVKYSKAAANYRTPSVQAKKLCVNCYYFNPNSRSCDIVAGVIRPQDTCDLWRSELYIDDQKKRHKKPYKAGDKQEVRQPVRAGPFRGREDREGEEAGACCGEGSCCYTEESSS